MNETLPVCVKLISGESIFAESDFQVDSRGFMTFIEPCIVEDEKNRFSVSEWLKFSDSNMVNIHSNKVMFITELDERSKRLYGHVLMSIVTEKIKKRLFHVLQVNVSMRKNIDELFSEFVLSLLYIESKYNIPAPEQDELRNHYDIFTLNLINNQSVSIQ